MGGGTWSAKEDKKNEFHLAEKTEDVWNNNSSNILKEDKCTEKEHTGFPLLQIQELQK